MDNMPIITMQEKAILVVILMSWTHAKKAHKPLFFPQFMFCHDTHILDSYK